MKEERTPYEALWRDLSDFILPWRGQWFVTDKRKGRQNDRIINSAATKASRTLASGLLTGLTSPARPWFRLNTPDPGMMEYSPVKEWLYIVENRMRDIFARSNLYISLHTLYRDLGVFGPAAMLCDADMDDVVRFYPYEIGSYYLATSAEARVDTLCREFTMTVRQVVDKFGIDRVTQGTKAAYENCNYDQRVNVSHLIAPNTRREYGRMDGRNKPWMSVYYEDGQRAGAAANDDVLRNSGYEEFPAMCPRWDATQRDVYGWSAGTDAIGDIKQLQFNEKRKMAAVDKIADPPMQAPAALKNRIESLMPGSVTYYDATQGGVQMQPLYQIHPSAVQIFAQDNLEVAQRVREAFYEDLFLMLATRTGPEMTAKEIAERHEEKLLALGPVLERLNSELLDPLIDRTFATMLRHPAQLLPPPPPELQGQRINVQYISVLAQSQQMVATSSMERFAGFVGQLAAASQDPSVLDKWDIDQTVDEYGTGIGVPPTIIRSDDKVAEIRAARQQQQQMMQTAAMAKPLADGAQAAKSLSEAVPTEENALGRLAEAATGGAMAPA